MNEELLYNQIYEKTKDCGRTQFIKLLMDKDRENQELKEQQKEFIKYLESKINKIRLNSNTTTLRTYSKKIIPYIEILSKYKEIIGSDKQ